MEYSRKMFNCPTCGPIETCYIQGEWANQTEYVDMVFEVVRPSSDTFEASVSTRSSKKPEGMHTPRILADIENYAEAQHKFQCSKCNRIFVIPMKAKDTSTVAGGPATLQGPQPSLTIQPPNPTNIPRFTGGNVGQNAAAVRAIFDAALSEPDLDIILTDMGEDPSNHPDKASKLDWFVDGMY